MQSPLVDPTKPETVVNGHPAEMGLASVSARDARACQHKVVGDRLGRIRARGSRAAGWALKRNFSNFAKKAKLLKEPEMADQPSGG